MKKRHLFVFLLGCITICLFVPLHLYAEGKKGLSNGQKIYAPAYSHIYIGNTERPFLLTVTLSIRNTDPRNPIKIIVADYYQSQGKLLVKYLDDPVILNPLGSLRYIIPERDKAGGSGANFIVEWKSERYINPPIIETIMIGTHGQQGISFTSRGQVIFTSN